MRTMLDMRHDALRQQRRPGRGGARRPAGMGPRAISIPAWTRRTEAPTSTSAARDAVAFESRWKGTLAAEAGKGGAGGLGEAVRDYEALEELIGPHRLLCRPRLCRRHDRPAARQVLRRHPGEDDRRQRASAVLRARAQPDRRRADRRGARRRSGASATTGPGSIDLRKDKPYQLEDRIEQLFHEKSITGRGAWNRLFDETMAALRFDVDGEELTLEPTLNRLQDADGEVRQQAAEALADDLRARTCAPSR